VATVMIHSAVSTNGIATSVIFAVVVVVFLIAVIVTRRYPAVFVSPPLFITRSASPSRTSRSADYTPCLEKTVHLFISPNAVIRSPILILFGM